METLPQALAPAFAAALALQHLSEIIQSAYCWRDPASLKKLVIALCAGLVAAVLVGLYPSLRVLHNVDAAVASASTASHAAGSSANPPADGAPGWIDVVVSSLIISAGTDGFNSILKFLTYKKDETKDAAKDAANERGRATSSGAPLPKLPAPSLA
jgi:hypothetical protein